MTDLDRRTVLRGVALTGAIGACPMLAACGSAGGGGSGGGTAAPASPSESTTGTPSPSPSESAGGGEVLGSASEIPVGGGKVFTDAEVVVTQPTKGEFKGFSAICTHQGCIVAEVAAGAITCGCHGSMFSVEDASVVGGPAPTPLPEKPVSVQGDQIVLG